MKVRFAYPSTPAVELSAASEYETRHEELDFSTLTAENIYWIIGIEGDWYRVLNDDGEPLLYPPQAFVVVDETEPPEWVTEYGGGRERYSYPPVLAAPGFFEDYFDGQKEARQSLRRYLQHRRRAVAAEGTAEAPDTSQDRIAA